MYVSYLILYYSKILIILIKNRLFQFKVGLGWWCWCWCWCRWCWWEGGVGCVGIVGGVGIVVADCCKGWHQVLVLVLLGVVCAPSTPCTPPQGGGGGPPLHSTHCRWIMLGGGVGGGCKGWHLFTAWCVQQPCTPLGGGWGPPLHATHCRVN